MKHPEKRTKLFKKVYVVEIAEVQERLPTHRIHNKNGICQHQKTKMMSSLTNRLQITAPLLPPFTLLLSLLLLNVNISGTEAVSLGEEFNQQQQQRYGPSGNNNFMGATQSVAQYPMVTRNDFAFRPQLSMNHEHRQQQPLIHELPISSSSSSDLFSNFSAELAHQQVAIESAPQQLAQAEPLNFGSLNGRSMEQINPVNEKGSQDGEMRDTAAAASAGHHVPLELRHPVPLQVEQLLPQQLAHQMQQSQAKQHHGQQLWHGSDAALVGSAAKRPPIYRSAPKQISELGEIGKKKSSSAKAKYVIEVESESMKRKKLADLHTAAGHYSKGKKHKKVKVYHVYYKKKRRPKKKIQVHYYAAPVHKPKHHHKPHYRRLHYHDHGKYYEYRSVPKKGAWKFGYKRGNKKHTIERKEHGHKSHFKTEVKWTDKKGKGHHVFDYNHHDKHKHGHHADHYHKAASRENNLIAGPNKEPQEAVPSVASTAQAAPVRLEAPTNLATPTPTPTAAGSNSINGNADS